MKTAIAVGVLIAGTFFGLVLVAAGSSPQTVFVAAVGIFAGMAALYPLVEWYVKSQRHAEARAAAASWVADDPHEFARAVADLFAEELEEATSDRLAVAMLGAANLSAALGELVHRASARRYEELLRSRTWLP